MFYSHPSPDARLMQIIHLKCIAARKTIHYTYCAGLSILEGRGTNELLSFRADNNNNNNNNNYKTSIAPISSKRIELSGAPSIQGHMANYLRNYPTNVNSLIQLKS